MIRLKILFLLFGISCLVPSTYGQKISNFYSQIDSTGGTFFTFKGKIKLLGPKTFYVDGSLSDAEASKYPYVFNSLQNAVAQLSSGTEAEPMTLYLAPWVYWVDDPDDPTVRIPKDGSSTPFGMEIDCPWLKFYGLTDNPYDVVLAANRGQTMGAKGNFTLFNFKGDGLTTENLTFGNYCNIDLNYLNPKLNREKRGPAIVQAQLAFSDGDKVLARNCNFISRLNTGPFWGSKRTLFEHCHFESTDDALNGSAVYLNCIFDFYSSKPFGHTSGTGAVFLNCDLRCLTRGEQYLVKGGGPVTLVDSRFEGEQLSYLGWRDLPATEARYYQFNVKLNDKAVRMDTNNPLATVDMSGKSILDAYRFELDGQPVYNTWNLLHGDDDWDPMAVKEAVLKAEAASGKTLHGLPTFLQITPTRQKLETGKDSLLLTAAAYRFGNYKLKETVVNWSVSAEQAELVQLKVQADGSCLVIPTNQNDETQQVVVFAKTESGLEAASVLDVAPAFLPAPEFIDLPKILKLKDGSLQLNYQLDMPYADQSLVSWYRCRDAAGSSPVLVAVSRFNQPMTNYRLSAGDIGWYLKAEVSPKHLRCLPGKAVSTTLYEVITVADVKQNPNELIPDLAHLPGDYQPLVLPGFFTLDSYAPADTREWYWEADTMAAPWYYGAGVNGAAQDSGLVQNTKGARLRYQPVGERFGDMKISFTAIPAKTAGQGFSSARAQYLDIGIKMDVASMNGYALRLVRTTKYGDAIDFVLMKYENGVASPISEPVSASCFRPNCQITVWVEGNLLKAHAENQFDYFTEQPESEVKRVVDMQTEIQPNAFGGFSFQHTGTVDGGATLINNLKVEWGGK